MRKLFAVILLLAFVGVNAKEKKPSYNYQRAMEELQKENLEEAAKYFNKEITENPKNGYAYFWAAAIKTSDENFGANLETKMDLANFLTDVINSMAYFDNALKYIPKKDKEYIYKAHLQKSALHLAIGDTTNALNDLSASIKTLPQNPAAYEKRAQIYYEQKKYNNSNADYQKLIFLNQNDVMGYMGIGRNYNDLQKWNDAIDKFNHVEKIDPTYSAVHSYRAESYLGKGDRNKACDDLLSALRVDDDRAYYLVQNLEDAPFAVMKAKLDIQAEKEPTDTKWPFTNAVIHENRKLYNEAIKYYKQAYKLSPSVSLLKKISKLYLSSNQWQNSLKYIEMATSLDSQDVKLTLIKAYLLQGLDRAQEALPILDKYLTENPKDAFAYYMRGCAKAKLNDINGAIDDLDESIEYNPNHVHSYLMRGDMFMKKGKDYIANNDYKNILRIENDPQAYCCSYFAYLGLGDTTNAIKTLDSVMARDSAAKLWGNYYDAACFYARMNKIPEALRYFELAIQMGYRPHMHVDFDYYLDDFRKLPEFQELIKKYETKIKEDDGDKE